MTTLPTLDSIPYGMSVRTLADQLYPGILYDAALPQGWVDGCVGCGYDPRGQWVWGYPASGPEGGVPLPLIRDARDSFPVAMLDPETLYPWRGLGGETQEDAS